jgi:hypothetical protein
MQITYSALASMAITVAIETIDAIVDSATAPETDASAFPERFVRELPALFDDFPQSETPRDTRFAAVLADVEGSTRVLGRAQFIMTTVTNGDAMSAAQGGLAVNGTFMIIGAAESMQVSPLQLLTKCQSVKGWYSGTSIDSEGWIFVLNKNEVSTGIACGRCEPTSCEPVALRSRPGKESPRATPSTAR